MEGCGPRWWFGVRPFNTRDDGHLLVLDCPDSERHWALLSVAREAGRSAIVLHKAHTTTAAAKPGDIVMHVLNAHRAIVDGRALYELERKECEPMLYGKHVWFEKSRSEQMKLIEAQKQRYLKIRVDDDDTSLDSLFDGD